MSNRRITSMKPTIYLAGKINKSDWRLQLGINPEVASWRDLRKVEPVDHSDFAYSGPFGIGCNHGCWHGPYCHGAGARPQQGRCSEGDSEARRQRVIYQACLKQIARSHGLFAHISTADCFGTLTEIALAAQQGKFVALHFCNDLAKGVYDDLWFVRQQANLVLHGDLAPAFAVFVQRAKWSRMFRPEAVPRPHRRLA